MINGGNYITGSRSDLNEKEIIKAIISKSSNEINRFSRNGVKIQSFFFEISEDDNYKDLFSGFVFDTNGPFPYSEVLDEILSSLHFAGIIGSINPVLKDYTINISDKYFKTISNLVGKQELEKIEILSKKFSEKLGKKSFSV